MLKITMRSLSSSIVVHQPLQTVWEQISQANTWQIMTQAFAGKGARFHYQIETQGPLGQDSEVLLTKPDGHPVVRWRVSSWSPPNSLELTASDTQSRLSSFHILLKLQLESLDSDKTLVNATLVVLFLNSFVQIVSLLLPAQMLYARRLHQTLQTLRNLFIE